MRYFFHAAVLLIGVVLLVVTAAGQPPQYINYQGRLTDDAGEPITNTSPGAVITFTIWNHETESNPAYERWSTGAVYVPVEDGLFDFQLGPLPDNLFRDYPDLWLGIQVAADPEISPRTKLISAAYACHAGTVDDIYVDESGDEMTGSLQFDYHDDGNIEAEVSIGPGINEMNFYDTDSPQNNKAVRISAPTQGSIELFDNDDTHVKALLRGHSTGGELALAGNDMGFANAYLYGSGTGGQLQLMDDIGTPTITLNASGGGDLSAVFFDEAINNMEIIDEPGISNNGSTGFVTLTNTMDDLQSLTIEIPASGYIYLEGWCQVIIGDATSENYAYIQIDETSGGTHTPGYFVMVGMYEYPNSNLFYYSVYVNRIYFKDAGTYDFILEGKKMFSTHTIYCFYPNLTATYYPTSYTPIRAFSSSPEDHPEAKAVTAVDPITGDEQTVYELDLRYYELKAKETKIKALEAELELRQAERQAARGNQ